MNHDRPLATPLRPKPLSRVERQWINDLHRPTRPDIADAILAFGKEIEDEEHL